MERPWKNMRMIIMMTTAMAMEKITAESVSGWQWMTGVEYIYKRRCDHGIYRCGLAYMEDQFVSDLSDGAYMDAFSKYASLCDDFLTQAENGEPYDTGHLPKKKVSPWWIAGDLLIGVIIAFVMALIKKTKLKSVKSQVTAGAYEKAGAWI